MKFIIAACFYFVYTLFMPIAKAQIRGNHQSMYSINTSKASSHTPVFATNLINIKSNYDINSPPVSPTNVQPYASQSNKGLRIAIAPVTLFGLGNYTWDQRKDIRELRNRYWPNYHSKVDDYIQYLPALSVYGLNLAGIKGKHSLKRATHSYLLACLMTFGTVTTMKYTFKEMRPDNSTANSFPSGHTANAFMNATFLHKEYGQHRSPLYSFFGYGIATWTGVMRQLNNRHWLPDVLVGAGIGILSTELAYAITNRKYKNRGLNPKPLKDQNKLSDIKPHFINTKMGIAISDGDLLRGQEDVYVSTGFTSSIEGAFFFNKWLGIGTELGISSFPLHTTMTPQEITGQHKFETIKTQAMGAFHIGGGPYFRLSLPRNWNLMLNCNYGLSSGANGKIIGRRYDTSNPNSFIDETITKYKPFDGVFISPGLNITKCINRNIALGFYTKYKKSYTRLTVTNLIEENSQSETFNYDVSFWTNGLSITAFF
jgi:membrane-associated phospholipid phosphatase